MNIIYFSISFIAALVGAISGIGGGVIIKPTMDLLGTMSVSTISFLSGTTVLTMAIVSIFRNMRSKQANNINFALTLYLAIGSAFGGVLGKSIFENMRKIIGADNLVGVIQSIILLLINIGIVIYIKNKEKIHTLKVQNKIICMLIGLTLGIISSFLGIGGGPINIAILYYFFSMKPKETAINSLVIILFSQITSLSSTILTNSVPTFNIATLIVMCTGGVIGALGGSYQSKKMSDNMVEKLFSDVLRVLIVINIVNIIKFIVI